MTSKGQEVLAAQTLRNGITDSSMCGRLSDTSSAKLHMHLQYFLQLLHQLLDSSR
jgi:hypothetical protein